MLGEVELVLSIFDKLIDRTPTYSQDKKEKYEQLKLEYKKEKESNIVDHARLASLRDNLMHHVGSEIKIL